MKAEDIVGVCSGKNEALVKEHGATEVIDYTKVLEWWNKLLVYLCKVIIFRVT